MPTAPQKTKKPESDGRNVVPIIMAVLLTFFVLFARGAFRSFRVEGLGENGPIFVAVILAIIVLLIGAAWLLTRTLRRFRK